MGGVLSNLSSVEKLLGKKVKVEVEAVRHGGFRIDGVLTHVDGARWILIAKKSEKLVAVNLQRVESITEL